MRSHFTLLSCCSAKSRNVLLSSPARLQMRGVWWRRQLGSIVLHRERYEQQRGLSRQPQSRLDEEPESIARIPLSAAVATGAVIAVIAEMVVDPWRVSAGQSLLHCLEERNPLPGKGFDITFTPYFTLVVVHSSIYKPTVPC